MKDNHEHCGTVISVDEPGDGPIAILWDKSSYQGIKAAGRIGYLSESGADKVLEKTSG